MTTFSLLDIVAVLPILGPLGASVVLAGLRFAGNRMNEREIERLVRVVMLTTFVAVLASAWLGHGHAPRRIHYGAWFESVHYAFDISVLIDQLATVYLVTAAFITSIVGYFSARYLHRDPGFARFFVWFLAFVGGLNLLVLAGSFNLMVAGWEIVGLSSVFLVGFHSQRSGPARNSVQVFTAYRIADIGLLGAAAVIHFWIGSDRLPHWGAIQEVSAGALPAIGGFLVLWAAMGKSAQGPFAFWLPRAMEGPTPSSAIFYGALSVHAGAYLLLRMAPAWQTLAYVPSAIITVGVATAIYGAFVGRTRTDVKSMLAHASLAQVGLIFAEIGGGFHNLALWHMVGHTMLRTLQFLRAPSAITDWRTFHVELADSGTDISIARLFLPRTASLWLYRQSLGGLNLEGFLNGFVVEPVMRLARYLDFSEREFAMLLEQSRKSGPVSGEPVDDGALAQLKVGDA